MRDSMLFLIFFSLFCLAIYLLLEKWNRKQKEKHWEDYKRTRKQNEQ